jgi:hypothetical protein
VVEAIKLLEPLRQEMVEQEVVEVEQMDQQPGPLGLVEDLRLMLEETAPLEAVAQEALEEQTLAAEVEAWAFLSEIADQVVLVYL